jgi:DNA-binding NtrC family response regulator
MNQGGVFISPLPASGEVTIGRSTHVDVRIDDIKASRVHAVLRVGEHVEIVDRGSTNGTLVGDRRLAPQEPVRLELGSMITIGSTVLALQQVGPQSAPERVWSQAIFEARVENEERVARSSGTTFAIVRIESEPGAEPNASTSSSTEALRRSDVTRAQRFDGAMNEALRPTDVIVPLGPGLFEVLLPRTAPEAASAITSQLRVRLREAGFPVEVGFATYPTDGRSKEALEARAEAKQHQEQKEEAPPRSVQLDSSAMARLEPLVRRVASSTINVLILGETGVGKEVMAQSIHDQSPRASGPLVTFNCAALSESLLESELFGHEKGAFTGAVQMKRGLLETAEGGTVFLDEIGEMPLNLQVKLLRVLEQREVQRVGSLKALPIDVRFIAATNRDLVAEIAAKRFREDLYFRLNGMTLTIPPLRERVEAIEALARAFVAQASERARHAPPAIAPPAMALLKRHRWPGNIRELRNVMERATLLSGGDTITLEHIPAETMSRVVLPAAGTTLGGVTLRPPPVEPPQSGPSSAEITVRRPGDDGERARILAALEQCAGNQTKAAKVLGISRRTLVSRLSEYAIPRPRK